MNLIQLNILLADDDTDDCFFFQEALGELLLYTNLTTVQDGEQLMQLLTNETNELPISFSSILICPEKTASNVYLR